MSSNNAPKIDLKGLISSSSALHQPAKENRDVSTSHPSRKEIKIILPVEDYAVLAKRAAQEGISAEVLVAQEVGKLLQ